jgi:hypothetical protein
VAWATLIEVEVLEALARDRGVELAPHEHGRNLTTRGVPHVSLTWLASESPSTNSVPGKDQAAFI